MTFAIESSSRAARPRSRGRRPAAPVPLMPCRSRVEPPGVRPVIVLRAAASSPASSLMRPERIATAGRGVEVAAGVSK